MAELNNFIKSLEKELTCSICEEIFTEPKQLHCLHSFCLKCIDKWNETCKNQRQRLTCPTCRSREDVDVSKLQSSFYLDSLKQLLLAMRNKAGKPDDKLEQPNCVSCQEHVKLVAFCQQCQGMICTDCVNAHKKLKQLQHQVIMFIDFKQEHVNSYISIQVHCEEKYHEKQNLEYFCQTCEKCICPKCSNTTHGTHEKLSIEEKADEMKRLINNSLHRVHQQKQRFMQELELSKQNMRQAENEIETAKKEVSHHVQAQIKILKDHENAMTMTLDEILGEQKTANNEEQNEINTVIQQLDALNEQSKRLQDQNVDYFILQSQIPQRCEELMQTRGVLSSEPIKRSRNTSVHYTPNHQVTQSLQDIGKIEESVTDPFRCSIELQNEEIRCGFVNKFEIVTRNSEGDVCYTNKGSIDVEIKDEDGCEVEIKLVENQTGKYIVTYKAEKLSQYEILVNIAGNTIKNSPIKVRTLDATETNFKTVKIIGEQTDFNLPLSLEVNDSQEAAIVDWDDHRIAIFSRNGKCLRKFGVKGTEDGKLYEPIGVVMYDDIIVITDNPDGNCGRIQEFDVNGAYLRTIYRQEGTILIRMCTTGADNISVLSYCATDDKRISIKLFSKHSGQFIRDIPISTVTRDVKELPYNIACGNNKYFLSYSRKNYIGVYDDNGGLLYKFGDKGKGEGQFDSVTGLAVYGEHMLLVCDGNNHRVQVFTQEGQYITSFGSHGSRLGQMNVPADVAVTSDGKVFVLECHGKRVQVWQ